MRMVKTSGVIIISRLVHEDVYPNCTHCVFTVFAGTLCLFLLPILLHLLLLAVGLTSAIPFTTILVLSSTSCNFNMCKITHLFVFLTQYHFSNLCIGSLSDIVLPSTYRTLSSKQHICIHCSLVQDSLEFFYNLILIYFLLPVLRQKSELAFSVVAPTLKNSFPVSVKSVGNIAPVPT